MALRFRALPLVLALVSALSAPLARAAEITVRVGEYYFHPPIVTIAPGDTVTWFNEGFQPHDSTAIQGAWASPTMFAEETFSFTFTSAGEFPYVCLRHVADFPQQTGLVVVASMNLPPSVHITSPATGMAFLAPATFSVVADASDGDGSVTNVQFLLNGNPVGNSSGPTFSTTVSALPAGSYALAAIATDNQGAAATSDPISITVTNPATRYPLTVSVLPVGSGTVTLTPPQPAEGYDAGSEVTVTAGAAPGFAFSHWSGDAAGAANPLVLTMDSAKSVVANFVTNTVPTHALALAVNPAGGGTISAQPAPNGANGTYLEGTLVTLTAHAALDFAFTNWSGDAVGASNPITLTIDSDKTVTANFIESLTPLSSLTVITNPPGAGTVQISPPPNGANGAYIQGTVVTLTAAGLGTNAFSSWSGAANSTSNRISIVMDTDKSVTANFVAVVSPSYTLNIAVSPTNAGVVLVTPPPGTNGMYPAGVSVAIAAQANPGFRFANWSGDVNSTNNPIVVAMTGNRSVTAVFAPLPAVDFHELAGVYAGLLIDDSLTSFPALSYAASGFLKLRLSKTGAYSGSATIGGTRELFAGQFDRFGYAPLVARRSTLSGSLQMDDAGLRIEGVLTDGRKASSLLLYRTAAVTNVAGFAGDYTVELPATGSVEAGTITMRILDNGAVRIHGMLGDGTEFNERTFISPDASIPLFAPLYGRRGVMTGWLNMNTEGAVQGSVRWFRPGNSRNVIYPNGFGLVIPVTGSRSF